jgi:hypothetical protein
MATFAAESRSQTESLFAENNEPFFNTIDPERTLGVTMTFLKRELDLACSLFALG